MPAGGGRSLPFTADGRLNIRGLYLDAPELPIWQRFISWCRARIRRGRT
jgi:hypothetical protein